MKRFITNILFFVCATVLSYAQEHVLDTLSISEGAALVDTIVMDASMLEGVKVQKVPRDWSKWRPSPKKATWYALIPGGGQIYNRKYWKLPIIYGGFVGCIYAWRWNGQMYSDYSQAYLDIMDDDPNTKSYEQFLHFGGQIDASNLQRYQNLFKSRKDRFRRWRDLSIFCLIGVYALSIIDAYVDASLSEFDISDDLTLHVRPTVMGTSSVGSSRNPLSSSGVGVNCALTF